MKQIVISLFFALLGHLMVGQEIDNWVTPERVTQLKATIEEQIPSLKQQLVAKAYDEAAIEFAIDTFRVERLIDLLIEEEQANLAINDFVAYKGVLYDQLLNKYYKKLIARLQPEDRETLKKTQRAWLAYRDTESALIEMVSCGPKYTDGGKMYIAFTMYYLSELVKQRTIMLYDYYALIEDADLSLNR